MKQEGKKRVGIMGGTFDPIHLGHLILAERAYDKFDLDKVLIMPTGKPPHKSEQQNTPAKQRAKMAMLAIDDNKHFEISLMEVEREGYTYTYQTIEELKKKNKHTDYYFIMGADSLFSLEKWREPERVCHKCYIVVATRYNLSSLEIKKQIQYLEKEYDAKIETLDTPNIDISSKIIRTMVNQKKSIRYYVPKDVETFIYKNGLYKH